jgi:hypothetical protein
MAVLRADLGDFLSLLQINSTGGTKTNLQMAFQLAKRKKKSLSITGKTWTVS